MQDVLTELAEFAVALVWVLLMVFLFFSVWGRMEGLSPAQMKAQRRTWLLFIVIFVTPCVLLLKVTLSIFGGYFR
jgi:hypothetical protein